jgi:RNA-directed DNA polymerase
MFAPDDGGMDDAFDALGFEAFINWGNLVGAYRRAARGKRSASAVANFEYALGDRLVALQRALAAGTWRPGRYVHFTVHEPKRRLISAAPFSCRVVHHALCAVIEPRFEVCFINDSFANRVGKGTHRAVDRLHHFAQRHAFVLRLDVRQHFPSIDHQILLDLLWRHVPEPGLRTVIEHIVASGDGIDAGHDGALFPGDDLLALARPRGLPIGNLTSQFWSNCYLDPLDHFVRRTLRCPAYLRYADDFALFHDDKAQLADWRAQLIHFLATRLRLQVHERAAQALPCRAGIPWLGFVVYPDHRRVKARKVVVATRRLAERHAMWRSGEISFAEFDASVQGWINHVRFADTWGLREHVLAGLPLEGRQLER